VRDLMEEDVPDFDHSAKTELDQPELRMIYGL